MWLKISAMTMLMLLSSVTGSQAFTPDQAEQLCRDRGLSETSPYFTGCVNDNLTVSDSVLPEQDDPALKSRKEECLSYGAKPGTDIFINCMVKLSERDALVHQRAQQSLSDQRPAVSRPPIIFRSSPIAPVILPMPRQSEPVFKAPTHCVTQRGFGNTIDTNCY